MENINTQLEMRKFSAIILRVGLGLVMIWFGSTQIADPDAWVVYLPALAKGLAVSEISLIYINGWFEVIFGILLIAGFYTRIVAFLLAIHLLGIVCTVGYNEIGVRDFGLTVALFSIFLYGASGLSLDEYLEKKIT